MMHDCDNVTMREMLPDLLHDRLSASARATVQAHVDGCADCRAELELLRSVVAGAVTPKVDTARIVAALPAYRKASLWVSAARSWPLRAAAAVVLLAGTATFFRDGTPSQPDTLLAAASTGLAVGAMTDIPDSDLRALAAELRKLQAVTPAEPEVVVPGVGRGSNE